MTTTERHTTRQPALNPTLEIHTTCVTCCPTGTRGLCGAPLHGIQFPNDTPTTCVVCPQFTRCPDCGIYLSPRP